MLPLHMKTLRKKKLYLAYVPTTCSMCFNFINEIYHLQTDLLFNFGDISNLFLQDYSDKVTTLNTPKGRIHRVLGHMTLLTSYGSVV